MTKKSSPLLMVVVVLVLVAGLVLMFVQWGSLRAERERLAEEEQLLTLAQGRLQAMQTLEARSEALEAENEALAALIPDAPYENRLIRDLQAGADLADMNLQQISFSPRENGEGYTEMPVSLVFDGTYHELLSLLDYLQVYERAVRVDDLIVDMSNDDEIDLVISLQASAFYTGE